MNKWITKDGLPRDIVFGWWGLTTAKSKNLGFCNALESKPEVGVVHEAKPWGRVPRICSTGMHHAKFNNISGAYMDEYSGSQLFLTGVFGSVDKTEPGGYTRNDKESGLFRVYLWKYPHAITYRTYDKLVGLGNMAYLQSKGAPISLQKIDGYPQWAVDRDAVEFTIENYEGGPAWRTFRRDQQK